MSAKVALSTEEILRGLKHYRRIAKQDVLRAAETPNPEAFRLHAESRREVYAELAEVAERGDPEAVVERALELYRSLPFLSGTGVHEHTHLKGRESGLEHFFLMIGLDPKVRREARSARQPLPDQPSPA